MTHEAPGHRDIHSDPKKWEHLDSLKGSMTDSRAGIVSKLKTRSWFQNTKPELQKILATLPQEGKENHDGFLGDMARRPNKIGGVTVTSLADLARGTFALIPKFNVVNPQGQEFTYEYVSWRYGPDSGAKGLVFVRDAEKKISHFIVLRGEKFAPGETVFDTVGGFADLNVGGVKTMLDRVKTEVTEELGVPDLKVRDEDIYDLGKILPDAGMTNNNPRLFAAVIDGSEATKVPEGFEVDNPDAYELRAGAIVIPIKQLPEVIKMNDDSFFLSAVSRSLAHGVIKWPEVNGEAVPYRFDAKE